MPKGTPKSGINKGWFKKGHIMSDETKEKISKNNSRYWLNKRRADCAKCNHYKWKGGTPRYYRMQAKKTLEDFYRVRWENMFKPQRAIIHHINSDFTDNRFDNLCVMSNSEHITFHNLERIKENPEYKYFGKNIHLRGD